jgi:tape measure domain-containing protein
MSDSAEFEVDMGGNIGPVAHRFASELARMNAILNESAKALARTETASSKLTQSLSRAQLKRLQEQSVALDRLRKGNTAAAPAMANLGHVMRGFGVHGGTLRNVTVEAAKMEVALRRLYRLKGGGVAGAGAVAGSLASRAWNGGLRERAGSALWSGAKGAAGLAVGAGTMAAGGAAVGVGLLGYEMTSTALEAERVKFALDRITNGQGNEWWANASDYAKKFGLNVNGVANSLMQMKAVGFGDDLAKETYLRFGDMRSQGVSAEGIDRALLGLKQLKAAGITNMEDLNQVTEGLMLSKGLIFEQLAKMKGKSYGDIRKLQETGKIQSTDTIQAIFRAIAIQTKSPVAGEAGSAATSSTTLGAWDKLKATWSVASTKAMGSESLAPIRIALGNFTTWIDGPGGEKAIGAFGGMMARLFESAPAVIEKVIWLLETGLPAAWEGFSSGFESSGAGGAMANIQAGFRGLAGPDGANAAATMRQFGSDVGKLVGALATLAGWIVTVIEKLGSLGSLWSGLKFLTVPTMAGAIGDAIVGGGTANPVVAANDNAAATRGASPREMLMARMAEEQRLRNGSEGIPKLEDSARAIVAAQMPKLAAPVINQNTQVYMQEAADGHTPAEVGDAVNDRSERGMTSALSQLGYSF